MNQVDLTTKHTQKADELSLLDRVVLILEQGMLPKGSAPGRSKIVVKVVDIFDNDTMTIVEVAVGGKK